MITLDKTPATLSRWTPHIITSMWRYLSVIIFLIVGFPSLIAQTIDLEPFVNTQTLGSEILLVDPSINGDILILDRKGNINQIGQQGWLIPLKYSLSSTRNITDFTSLRDTIFFIQKNNLKKIYQSGEELILTNLDSECFTKSDHTIFVKIKNGYYNILTHQIESISHHQNCSKKQIPSLGNTLIEHEKSMLKWRNLNQEIIDSIPIKTDGALFVDVWNRPFYYDFENIYMIHLSFDQIILPPSYPTYKKVVQTLEWGSKRLLLFEDGKLYHFEENKCRELFSEYDEFWVNVFTINNTIALLNNKNELYLLDQDQLRLVDFHGVLKGKIKSITSEGKVISLLTDSGIIYQTRINGEVYDWTWSELLHYQDLLNYQIQDITYSNEQLYALSLDHGIFTFNSNGIENINFPSNEEYIESWNNDENQLLVKSNLNNLAFITSNGELEIFWELDREWEWFNSESIDYIIYQDTLSKLDFLRKKIETTTIETPYLGKSWITQGILYTPLDKGIKKISLWKSNDEKLAKPILSNISILTINGHELTRYYPFLGEKNITVKENEFPLSISFNFNSPNKLSNFSLKVPTLQTNSFTIRDKLTITENDIENLDSLEISIGNQSYYYQLPKIVSVDVPEENSLLPWILLSGILATSLIIAFLYSRWKSNKHQQHIEDLKMKNRILELEQLSLQLQMNPHFLFNAINSIQGMIVLGRNKDARKYLGKLSTLMRGILNHSRARLVTIKEELFILENYMDLEQALHEDRWTFSFHIDPSIDMNQTIPPMMLQPFLENAVKHAFQGISYPGLITLSMEQKGRRLLCRIEDNGRGMDFTKNNSSHQSVALDVIKSRLEWLNQGTKLEEYKVINKDDIGEGTGVIVQIVIPIIDEEN